MTNYVHTNMDNIKITYVQIHAANYKTIINFMDNVVNYCEYLVDPSYQHCAAQNQSIKTML